MSGFKNQKNTLLLLPEENKDVHHMIGRKCTVLVTTVIQLYRTNPPQHSKWTYQDCGVLVFVKDRKERCYFFRLYCLVRKTMVWEYGIHKDLEYTCPRHFFSSFEGEECIYAFNFACAIEARAFNASVLERLSNEHKISTARERKTKKKPISKKNISHPIAPQHNFHVGFKNMDVLKMSPKEIESYFEKKNINRKVLQPSTEVVPSVVEPISVFPENKFQKNTIKSSTLNSFQNSQESPANVPFKIPNLSKTKFESAPSVSLVPRARNAKKVSFSLKSEQPVVATSQPQLDNVVDNDSALVIDDRKKLLEINESIKQLLSRRQQVTQSSDDDSSFTTDDDWDD